MAKTNSIDLLVSVMDQLKLKYTLQEEESLSFKWYRVRYRKVEFDIAVDKKWKFLMVTYLGFDRVPINDVDYILKIHQVIDYVNFGMPAKLVLSGTDEDYAEVHAVQDLYWIPEIPNLGKHLKKSFGMLMHIMDYYFEKKEELVGMTNITSEC
jgi:hypothetical protein